METLFFVLSKVVWIVLRPESWLVVLLLGGLWALGRGHVRRARVWLLGLLGYVLILGVFPLGLWVLGLLEPAPLLRVSGPVTGPVTGIVILGGAEDALLSAIHGQPVLNGAAERLMEGLALARAHPQARVIYTGGSGSLRHQAYAEATVAEEVLLRAGLASERLDVERASRTTWENAVRTEEMVRPAPGEIWLLVTSAFHMRRAQGAFCAVGWAVTPWPTDYRSAPIAARMRWDLAKNLVDLNTGIKEWVGLLAYRLTGRWRDPSACTAPL